ncbi:AAA family ATPase, partial [Tepidimonas sp.]|uniref:AAA family ATPase n=1 Tax=Tepidimonas sp. TaxID=2002775 RepID=UPI00391A7BE7
VTGIERPYNIGVLTTDMVVADVDVKNNKPGLENYYGMGGHFDTLVIRTPTGGYHCYFNGPDSSLAPLADGLDIRSHNGYVVGPGSVINGRAYEVFRDQEMAWVPAGIEERLRQPGRRVDRDYIGIDLDSPTGIETAKVWLRESAPEASAGGRNPIVYQVACTLVRDYALTVETAYQLMLSWNEMKVHPPYEAERLWSTIEHAEDYGTGDLGTKLPEQTFGTVSVPEAVIPQLIPQGGSFGNARSLASIPPRPWLIKRLLMRGQITLMPAAGSSGKSSLALTIAAHGAVGKGFGPYEIAAPFKSVVYNAEDDLDEQSRRLYAICQEYKLDFERVKEGVLLLSSDDLLLTVAYSSGNQVVTYDQHVQAIVNLASDPDVGLLVLDPLVEIHNCDEQDNGEMRQVMGVLRRITKDANVAGLIPHHTNKQSGSFGQNRAGNPDTARGAGAIINSARIAVTLFNASDEDRRVYGITEDEKHLYARLDDAKMNLSLASSRSVWFKKTSVRLYNGDDVGVMKFHHMNTNEDTQRRFIAEVCAGEIMRQQSGSISVKQATLALQLADSLYEKMTEASLRTTVEKALRGEGVAVDHRAGRPRPPTRGWRAPATRPRRPPPR